MRIESSPFGSRTRTGVLLVLAQRGEAQVRQLSRLLRSPLSVVQHALRTLERDGLLTSRSHGRARVVSIDPACPARAELVAYLRRLAELEQGAPGAVAAIPVERADTTPEQTS